MRLSGSWLVNGKLVQETWVIVKLFLDLFEIS